MFGIVHHSYSKNQYYPLDPTIISHFFFVLIWFWTTKLPAIHAYVREMDQKGKISFWIYYEDGYFKEETVETTLKLFAQKGVFLWILVYLFHVAIAIGKPQNAFLFTLGALRNILWNFYVVEEVLRRAIEFNLLEGVQWNGVYRIFFIIRHVFGKELMALFLYILFYSVFPYTLLRGRYQLDRQLYVILSLAFYCFIYMCYNPYYYTVLLIPLALLLACFVLYDSGGLPPSHRLSASRRFEVLRAEIWFKFLTTSFAVVGCTYIVCFYHALYFIYLYMETLVCIPLEYWSQAKEYLPFVLEHNIDSENVS